MLHATNETEIKTMKKLLFSTALVAATSMPVFAQGTEGMFRQEVNPQEIHASDFIGMRVYRSDNVEAEEYEGVQEGWDDIGEINDVVFSREGEVEAVLVDIGGFLGIGENQVAVDMDSIRFVADSATVDQETDFFLVLSAPRGALEEAPVYGAGSDEDAAAMDRANESADAGDDATREAGEDTDMAATPDAGATGTQMNDDSGLAREGYVTATEDELVVGDLNGAPAYDANDKRIGEVSDLLMADDGKIQAAIVDVGGFLGIGKKPVQLELSKLDILRTEDGSDIRVYISMTEEELESLPEYEN